MLLGRRATRLFWRWLTDDNDKWFHWIGLFDVTHHFDVRIKMEKIKREQTHKRTEL